VVQGSLVYRDDRLRGFDAAVAVEVIEHMELPNLARFAAAIFGHARPGFVVLTTPNREYNVRYNLEDKLRHNDHRFEWTRSEFELWCGNVAMRYGYTTRFAGIGDFDEAVGHTSQMCTFERTTEQAPAPIGKASVYEPPLLDLGRLLAKRDFQTSLVKHMFIKNGHAECAVEQLSRFAIDPRWLVYLPPTMSPPDTGPDSGWHKGVLEHPDQVFKYFRERGVKTLVAEEKHMGSRAIVIVCRNEAGAEAHFGVGDGRLGACYTRNGNAFFHDAQMEFEFIARMHRSLSASRFWNHHETNWVMLDCEIMPWSAKARGLLVKQYAPVAAAGRASLQAAIADLELAKERGLDVDASIARHHERLQCINLYQDAYRRYCWPVASLDHYKVAPFHILATEGQVHTDKNHLWHMNRIARVALYSDGLIIATPHRTVDLDDRQNCEAVTSWWTELTEAGGEGLVFKPFDFVTYDTEGQAVQPAVKCRGESTCVSSTVRNIQ
jgi:protein phosphatase